MKKVIISALIILTAVTIIIFFSCDALQQKPLEDTETPSPSTACFDLIQNGTESDVDCGGSCPKCADSKNCDQSDDCQSIVCKSGICQSPTCSDTAENGLETDVDCGGTTCVGQGKRCADMLSCKVNNDCQSYVCQGLICRAPRCDDNTQNGLETDLDCGGTTCVGQGIRCGDNKYCNIADDCVSKVCFGSPKTCRTPTCADAVENGTESDIDCGGICSSLGKKCLDNKKCFQGSDCQGEVCENYFCKPGNCSDSVKNYIETDIDCGGTTCVGEGKKCTSEKGCNVNNDCISNSCVGNICKATCTDGVKDGQETDIDCGGMKCVEERKKCASEKGCNVNEDCISGSCIGGFCQ